MIRNNQRNSRVPKAPNREPLPVPNSRDESKAQASQVTIQGGARILPTADQIMAKRAERARALTNQGPKSTTSEGASSKLPAHEVVERRLRGQLAAEKAKVSLLEERIKTLQADNLELRELLKSA